MTGRLQTLADAAMLRAVALATGVAVAGAFAQLPHDTLSTCGSRYPDGTVPVYGPVKEYVFEAATSFVEEGSSKFPGARTKKEVYRVNGSMVGPMIMVDEGDTVQVTYHNALLSGVATTMHWHGMYQQGTPYMDGVDGVAQCGISSGHEMTYIFKAYPAGTHWYHSHTGVQYGDGLRGPLIVKSQEDPAAELYDFDLESTVLFITDYMPETSNAVLLQLIPSTLEMPNLGPSSDWSFSDTPWYGSMLNGHDDDDPYVMTLARGARYRLRLIYGGASWNVIFSIAGHPLTIIALDGSPCQPLTVDSIKMGPGDRVDVIVTTGSADAVDTDEFDVQVKYEGELWWASTEDPNVANNSNPVPASIPAKIKYEAASFVQGSDSSSTPASVEVASFDPTVTFADMHGIAVPDFPLPPPTATRHLNIVLGGNMETYQWTLATEMGGPGNFFQYPVYPSTNEFHDNTALLPLTEMDVSTGMTTGTLNFNFEIGEVVDISFINPSSMSHPMHIHGSAWYVLGTSGADRGNTKMSHMMNCRIMNITMDACNMFDMPNMTDVNLVDPVVRDNILVPYGGVTTVRFIANNPGMWAMHCHIEYHMAQGMFSVFTVGPSNEWPMPPKSAKLPPCGQATAKHS